MKVPFKLTAPPKGWTAKFPDGDFTVGRGADPLPQSLRAEKIDRKSKKTSHASRRRKASRVAAE